MRKHAPRTRKPITRRLRSFGQTMWQRTLSQQGAPEKIALGAAIGFFIGWLPIMGLQMGVAFAICAIIRANFAASIPGVWVTNPITIVPFYYAMNQLGALIAGKSIGWHRMERVFEKVAELGAWEGTKYLCSEMSQVTVALFIGGAIFGAINAVIIYPIVLTMVRRYQRHRVERRAYWRSVLDKLLHRHGEAGEPAVEPTTVPPPQDVTAAAAPEERKVEEVA